MSLFKRLLIALLVAALPLQGYAAAAMLYCHTAGVGDPAQVHSAVDRTHVHADEPASQPALVGTDAHHQHQGHAGSAAMAQSGDLDDASPVSGLFAANCSVCSSMCIGAAIVASTPVLPVTFDGRAPFEPVASVFTGVVLDLPDPPPLAAPL